MILTNSKAGKLATIEIPAKISKREFEELVKFNNIFSLLGVETKALISSFDVTKIDGGPDYNVNNNEVFEVPLAAALSYLSTNEGMVLPEINLCNVYKKENLYRYETEEQEVLKTR